MSTVIMAKCWPLQMSPAQKAVLISLADQANDHGVCWPSIETICQRTCLSRRAVILAIGRLETIGVIVAKKEIGRSSRYHLDPSGIRTRAADAPVHHVHHPRAADAPPPCTTCTTPVHHVHPNRKEPTRTVNEPSMRAKASMVDVPAWIPGEAWSRFVDHRKSIKKPLTADAARLAINALDKLRAAGNPPAQVIDQSIFNGWAGVFALRDTGAGSYGNARGGGGRRESDAERIERINREHDIREQREAEARGYASAPDVGADGGYLSEPMAISDGRFTAERRRDADGVR